MTEDLQPGDVFLVQHTVDEQHQAYTKSGFLAFENHVAAWIQAATTAYGRSFYLDSEQGLIMPRTWLEPAKEHSFEHTREPRSPPIPSPFPAARAFRRRSPSREFPSASRS